MTSPVRVSSLTGAKAQPHLDDLARLRIEVFRDFPYLYDGSLDYERRYLDNFSRSDGSVIAVAFDGDRVVGAATALPMADEPDYITAPFRARSYDIGTIFYFGESVLLRPYRGTGIGVRFFEHREAHARSFGTYRWAAFCGVDRPPDHPLRPADYVPLDRFWQKRGFVRHPELVSHFSWRDLGDDAETEKPMVYWLKQLT
ncbi:MAG: GNAT family N-acetyltransferase [Alphaproteobacteria bacterium]|nr:GNAT family N-acetyltransferase [Alphaproteobacteria bacterium]